MFTDNRKIGSGLESLEQRAMMAANISFNDNTGVLTITGDGNANYAEVRFEGDEVEVEVYRSNGTRETDRTVDIDDVRQIVFNAGGGNDTLNVTQENGLNLQNVSIIYNAGAGDDYMDNNSTVASSAFGGSGNDTLTGGTSKDVIDGGRDNDTINGRAGVNYLYGDIGQDTIYGGADIDTIWGDVSGDSVLGDADTIFGNAGNDWIYGGGGGDTIDGDGDHDNIFGEAGADYLYGDLGSDTINGGDDNDTIWGDISGNAVDGQADSLHGGGGADWIYGGGGDDYLQGGAVGADNDGAIDHLYGEGGIDNFQYDAAYRPWPKKKWWEPRNPFKFDSRPANELYNRDKSMDIDTRAGEKEVIRR